EEELDRAHADPLVALAGRPEPAVAARHLLELLHDLLAAATRAERRRDRDPHRQLPGLLQVEEEVERVAARIPIGDARDARRVVAREQLPDGVALGLGRARALGIRRL